MTPEQGDVLDIIIRKHKENNRVFSWNPFIVEYGLDNSHDYRKIIFVFEYLKHEKIIIDYTDNLTTQLTEKGQNWTNYKDYLREEKEKETAEKRESWQKRHWMAIALTSAVAAYVAGIFSDPLREFISAKFLNPVKKSSLIVEKDSLSNNVTDTFKGSSKNLLIRAKH